MVRDNTPRRVAKVTARHRGSTSGAGLRLRHKTIDNSFGGDDCIITAQMTKSQIVHRWGKESQLVYHKMQVFHLCPFSFQHTRYHAFDISYLVYYFELYISALFI